MRSLALPLSLVCALAALALSTPALAQVEARCPAGWTQVAAPEGPGQRMVAACTNGMMELVARELPRTIAPNDPVETQLANEIAEQLGQGGHVNVNAFRTETLGGVATRTADFQGTSAREDETVGPIEGTVLLVPANGSTVLVMAVARDPAQGNVRAAGRAFVPTMVGLTGGAPAWRASAACPPGTQTFPAQGAAAFGLRRVVRCMGQAAQIDVLESRLPVRAAPDVISDASIPFDSLRRGIARMGGTMTQDAPRQVTYGAVHAWFVPMHGSATNPQPRPGEPAGITVEAGVLVIPTSTGGHVRIVVVSQEGTAAALENTLRSFVTTQLRLDGTGVPPPAPAGGAPDAGTAPGEDPASAQSSPAPAARRRTPEIDPNVPIWQPPAEELGHPREPPRSPEATSERTKNYAIGFIVIFAVALLGWSIWQRRR